MNKTPNHRIQDLWQCQPVEGFQMSAEEICRRTSKFEKRIVWRNVREYVAGLIVTVFFGWSLLRTHDVLFRSAFAVLIAGVIYVLYQLHRKGAARLDPTALADTDCLQFYRNELRRQRDLLRSVWSWYLGPLVPGLVLLTVASALANPHLPNLVALAISDVFVAGVLIFVWKLNSRAARSLQRIKAIRDMHEAKVWISHDPEDWKEFPHAPKAID